MKRRSRIYLRIDESEQELRKLLRTQSNPLNHARVQALLLILTDQATNASQLSELTGYSRLAIGRWIETYREGGLNALLKEKKNGPNPYSALKTEAVRQALAEKLNDPEQGFNSYVEIARFVQDDLKINRSYQTIYNVVRQLFDARMKVPRKLHPKKDPEKEAVFKKLRFSGQGPSPGNSSV